MREIPEYAKMGLSLVLWLLMLGVVLSLACTSGEGGTVTQGVTWTAPGDDGNVGTATGYDIRWLKDSVALIDNFNVWGGNITIGAPVPSPAGSNEVFTITELDPNTVYFTAIKAVDDVGNWSYISNILRFETPDTDAPAAITDLRVE